MGCWFVKSIIIIKHKKEKMKCPNCDQTLVMTERQGVEIDYCPTCRGVWLDKGELDKIIEKSTAAESNQNLKQNDEKRKKRQDNDEDDDDDDEGGFFNRNRRDDNNENPNRRKGGFLGNLFDF
jgi:Zn-finger nucleic acid-binding protein